MSTDSTLSNSIPIPKTINLKVNTSIEAASTSTSLSKSSSTVPSSASSTTSSSSLSSILDLGENSPVSPFRLSPHSTPNFAFKLDTKLHNSNNADSDDIKIKARSASQPPPIHQHSEDEPVCEFGQEQQDEDHANNHSNSFSIFTFLRNEIEYIDVAITPIINHSKTNDAPNNSAEERIYNFFWLFFRMEKLLFFGFWICCDSFFLIITILPTRVLYRIYKKLSYLLNNEWILLYNNFIRYYFLYCYFTLKYSFLYKTVSKIYHFMRYIVCLHFIKDFILFICCNCCKSFINRNNNNILNGYNMFNNDNEYREYFENASGFCCKCVCLISCCCVCNRHIHYNKKYEKDRGKVTNKQYSDIPVWLIKLQKETFSKRMHFLDSHQYKYMYTGRDYLDIIRLLTLLLCVYILAQFNLSQIYHFIRAQENFKLYVLFKIIVIIQHLMASFGEDSIEALFNSLNSKLLQRKKICVNLCIYIFYNIIHSLLLYGHLITLNAAMNSPNNTLITILVADNFYELKSTVFKRYYVENVFQMLCSDIVERFTIFLFVLLILLQNLCYLGWDNFDAEAWFIDAFKLFLIMVGFEMIVDTMKHGFIIKNNNFNIKIYKSFYIRLCMDFTNARRMNCGTNDKLFFMDRRLGFSSLPLVTLFLRVMWQLSEYNQNHLYVKITFIVILFAVLYLFKLLLSLIMIAKSVKTLNEKQLDVDEQYVLAKRLSKVRRYGLFVKRIPT